MTSFIALATLLIVAAAIPLAWPLLRRARPVATGADRQAANLVILRDQLAELERERSEGSLSEADFEQAKKELQRRLLEEARPETGSALARETGPAKKTAAALIVLLPVLALGGYGLLGNPKALDPANRQPAPQVTAGDIEAMIGKLAERLKQNPDDAKGWVMLARSYKVLGRYPESAEAYGKGIAVVEKDAMLLADYAEMLAITQDGFRGRPTELIEKALKLAPDEPQVLLLAGAAAGERRDFAAAIRYWEKVVPQLEPGSEEAEAIAGAIARAKTMIGHGKTGKPPGK